MPTPIHELENLRSRRAENINAQRAILDPARADDRNLTAEERTSFEKLQSEFTDLSTRISDEEAVNALEKGNDRPARLAGARNNVIGLDDDGPDAASTPAEVWDLFASKEYETAYLDYARRTPNGMSPENRAVLDRVQVEAASYNLTTDAQGGYTVPETWRAELVESRTQFGVLRQLATIISTSGGEPIHIPTVTDAQVATLVAEAGPYQESEDTFGEVVLGSYKYAVLIKISEELINDSLFDLSSFISRRAGRAIALKEGAAFATGDGSAKPNGITHAASVGKTTADDDTFTANELLDMIHSVSPPYRTSSQWVMHDSTLLYIAKLVDDNNNYVWQPGLQSGEPDRIRGYQVYIDPFYDTLAAAKVIATFGDHSGYYIREAGPVVAQRLIELYAVNGQIGFRFAERVDGNLVDAAAVKSLKTHA